nr:altered inheritance of mitochondria protein 9, mitochondrial [Quercus suber]
MSPMTLGSDDVFRFNEGIRLRERRLQFNVSELANFVGAAVRRPATELVDIKKFAEGGFNRILQATFNDSQEVLARLPFKIEAALYHSVASEAATLHFLRLHGIPVPKVLDYSPVAANPVGTEFILLEKIKGTPLSEQWFSMETKVLAKVMKQIIDLEQKFMKISLPASGSLYFRSDLRSTERSVPLHESSIGHEEIVIGPTAQYSWWYRERAKLEVDRGPSVAKRERAFCDQYGKPRLHVEPYLRELQDFKLQYPHDHDHLLSDYLQMAPFLDVAEGTRFSRPTLRHPDFSPSNILVDGNNDIVGIIDWQHSAALPLCLCAGIPKHYQNWGDPISEALKAPETKLPANFDTLDAAEQQSVRETIRRRLVHFYYGAVTLKKSEDHFDALRNDNSMLRAKLYDRAAAPWEGDSLSLEQALIQVQEKWPMPLEGSTAMHDAECPVKYSMERIRICEEKIKEEEDRLQDLEEMRELLGTDALGWVQDDEHLAMANELKDVIKAGLLRECETESERIAVRDHFPFDDHEE